MTYTRLAFAGPAGDALRFDSTKATTWGPMQVGAEEADDAMPRPSPIFYIASIWPHPLRPDFGPHAAFPGINVAMDANPAARDAFGLARQQ